jgi:hypothetical protein
MLIRKLTLLCVTLALLAPLADAKMPKAPKRHNIRGKDVKVKKSSHQKTKH